MDSNEIPLHENDIVELRKIGSEGWWYVRHTVTGEEGWAPASYLESVKRRSSHSTLSMSSLGKVIVAWFVWHLLCVGFEELHCMLPGYHFTTSLPESSTSCHLHFLYMSDHFGFFYDYFYSPQSILKLIGNCICKSVWFFITVLTWFWCVGM